jgi:large subunit ribosomal protein L15
MVFRRAKKVRKQRGNRQHGWGRISGGHRSSGQRGGKGKAGLTKHHWILTIKNKVWENTHVGFVRHGPAPRIASMKVINLETINQIASKSTEKLTEFDVTEFGYEKVLGKGKLDYKLTIKAPAFTAHAEEKITAAGGKAIVIE